MLQQKQMLGKRKCDPSHSTLKAAEPNGRYRSCHRKMVVQPSPWHRQTCIRPLLPNPWKWKAQSVWTLHFWLKWECSRQTRKNISVISQSHTNHILIGNKVTNKDNQIYHILLNTNLPCYDHSVPECTNNPSPQKKTNVLLPM